jgi:hypothetical protein
MPPVDFASLALCPPLSRSACGVVPLRARIRRRWPRRLGGVLAGILFATAFAGADTATASPILIMLPSFSTGDLGEGAVVTDSFTIAGTEYHGYPQPLTKLVVHLPAGVEGSSSGFATCEAATIETVGPQGCSPGSIAGPVGGITMWVAFGTEFVEEKGTLQAFFGPNGAVNLSVQGHTPVSVEVVMTGTYGADSPPYGRALNVTMPLIETVPGAPDASITALTVAFGASHVEGTTEIHSVIIPLECPTAGFDWGGEAGFSDGTTVVAGYRSPCPRAASTSPVLGQREAIHVAAGKVTVRLKGSTAFLPLSGTSTIPNGSEVDTTDGRVLVTAATERAGQNESAEIQGGRLLIRQEHTHPGTHLTLSLPLTGCSRWTPPHGSAAAIASHAKHSSGPKSRRLWVSEHGGSWGTNGRYISTTVEGTRWLTVDECNRSEVQVAAGKVKVHDLLNNKTKTITARQDYIATRRSTGRHR